MRWFAQRAASLPPDCGDAKGAAVPCKPSIARDASSAEAKITRAAQSRLALLWPRLSHTTSVGSTRNKAKAVPSIDREAPNIMLPTHIRWLPDMGT